VAELNKEVLDALFAGTAEEILGPGGVLSKLKKAAIERILDGELTNHLGYEKHDPVGRGSGNSRNGKSAKTVLTESGQVQIDVPRDRAGTFEPQLVRKRQRRLPGFDDKVIGLYARGMTVREIRGHLEELYEVEVSPDLISTVTDAVLDEVAAWQSRTLANVWPIVYLDALVLKVREAGTVRNKAVHIALGVNLEGRKEVLGLWTGENEGAKFWLHVVTELRNRGVEDIFIACCDGLKGFPDAIESVFPRTVVQTCIVHLVRNSLRYVSYKNHKAVAKDLKPIYQAATTGAAEAALDAFDRRWGGQYPTIARVWRDAWPRVTPFFQFPPDIRRAIYTTNAIEALNLQLRKVLKTRGHFPNDEAAVKLLWLALDRASAKWTMPIKAWDIALQQFAITFDGRVPL
jgi:transposase-like protein